MIQAVSYTHLDVYKRQVQHSLFGVDVEDIGHPFAVGPVCLKWTIQKIFIFVQLLAHLNPFSPAANFCQKAVFLHDSQNYLGIAARTLFLQPQPHRCV